MRVWLILGGRHTAIKKDLNSFGCIYAIINIPINKTTSYAKLSTIRAWGFTSFKKLN